MAEYRAACFTRDSHDIRRKTTGERRGRERVNKRRAQVQLPSVIVLVNNKEVYWPSDRNNTLDECSIYKLCTHAEQMDVMRQ